MTRTIQARFGRTAEGRRGGVLVSGLIVVTLMMGLCFAVMTVTLRNNDELGAAVARGRAFDAANSGVAHAVANVMSEQLEPIGSADAPVAFSNGGYWFTIAHDEEAETFTIVSTGDVRGLRETVEVVVQKEEGGFAQNAIFAGNASDDPRYTLELGGRGGQADLIDGNVYSGGSISIVQDAEVTGTVQATIGIEGVGGDEGIKQPIPDIAGTNYAATADYDVAALFDADARYRYDSMGGHAWQMDESSPVHIFRKNPSDRTSAWGGTVKDDYFLEDPYESVNADYSQNGSNPTLLSLSGTGGEPGENGNRKVYYVDGNLWVHNRYTYSFAIPDGVSGGTQVTIVAKGNIYFSDNVFYGDENDDGLAFIAITDEDVEDSGNIYLGDPEFGTLKIMQAFMYAENDFYDINLDESGSAKVYLDGNMTAGNHVIIDRDYVRGRSSYHTKLTIDFDDRLASGELDMPGLPANSGAGGCGYRVVSWRRLPTN